MALLLKPASESADIWKGEFARLMPDLEIRVWPEVGDRAAIEVALVANLPFGELAKLPKLRLIQSLPVGVDHILNDPNLPAGVPVARSVDPAGDPMMLEFALMHVLRHHRRMPEYLASQQKREWRRLPQPLASERRVGVIGLGVFGCNLATTLVRLGFAVAGWSRRPKQVDGVECFAGADAFRAFLGRCQIVVALVPLTTATRGLLNAAAFAAMPKGADVINLSRGPVLIEPDLLAALDSGQIGSASLDVFETEPLPGDHALWSHPRVTVTPHVATVSRAAVSAPIVVENIRRMRAGQPLLNPVDRAAGY